MAKSLVGALTLALLPSTLAFRNTSPFFLFSTADLTLNENNVQVAPSDIISEYVKSTLEGCPSHSYFIVRQNGVSSDDFLDRLSTPRLAAYMTGEQEDIKTTISASEVIGSVDVHGLADHFKTACNARVWPNVIQDEKAALEASLSQDSEPNVFILDLPAPVAQTKARAATLENHDYAFGRMITEFSPSNDYTVIYTTTPPTEEQQIYEMEEPIDGGERMELKRDTSFVRRASSSNDGGLFEKYQYFSPGLFMAFSAMVPLILILAVGLRAIAALEVSYFAFSKEMGPTAQKKQ